MKHLVLAASLAAAISSPVQGEDYGAGYPATPPIRVIDGDTIVRSGAILRLAAIDAPELKQTCTGADQASYPCGTHARAVLQQLVRLAAASDWVITCTPEATDRYGRTVATCITSEGHDLGGSMIRLGWALPYYQYGGARYAYPYELALKDRAGMHQGTFQAPDAWRHAQAQGR